MFTSLSEYPPHKRIKDLERTLFFVNLEHFFSCCDYMQTKLSEMKRQTAYYWSLTSHGTTSYWDTSTNQLLPYDLFLTGAVGSCQVGPCFMQLRDTLRL